MKFGLKTTAVAIFSIAFGFTVVALNSRVRNLQSKLNDLRDSHGMVTQDLLVGGDRWECVPVGGYLSVYEDTFLVRVRNHQKYQLRLHFFDGETESYQTDVHEFAAQETAIRFLPQENMIYVHDTTLPIDRQTFFEISTTPRFYDFSLLMTGAINNDPILGFGMLGADPGPIGSSAPELTYGNRERIEKTCRKHSMKIAWFTIETRDE